MLQPRRADIRKNGACDNRRMGDSQTPKPAQPAPLKVTSPPVDKMMCERCGVAEMYRMHAVWRCPACGFKTDCCGW
jgi:hypothetical protein